MDLITAAQMGTRSSGTSDLELVPLAGRTPYSGSNAVEYSIITPLLATEEGTGRFEGGWLRGRTVTASSASDAAISIPMPPKGVVIYLTAQVPEVEAVFGDADYGDIIVGDDGTSMTIQTGAVTTAHLQDDAVTPAKLEGADTLTLIELQDELGVPNTDGKTITLVKDFIGVANGTYPLLLKAKWPFTIASLVHEGSEALTAAVKIGSTDVTGLSAVAITASTAESTATAANSVIAGNRVNVVFTDIATTGDVYLELVVTRA